MNANEIERWIGECSPAFIRKNNNGVIKLEEKKAKIFFLNEKKYLCYEIQVDGGLIKEGTRCDKMLISSFDGATYYIELKGVDILHGIEQLKATCSCLFWSKDCKRVAIMVGKNRLPKTDTRIQKATKNLMTTEKVVLLVLNSVVKYDMLTGSYQENQSSAL